jgi:hypothetical protein
MPTYLALTVRPEVDDHGNQVVQAGVGALVGEDGGQGEQWQGCKAGFQTAVDAGSGDEGERILPRYHPQSHDQVDNLENREGLYCRVECLRQEVEEYLGPKETFQSGSNLVCVPVSSCLPHSPVRDGPLTDTSREGDEPCPVILDKSTHICSWFSSRTPWIDSVFGFFFFLILLFPFPKPFSFNAHTRTQMAKHLNCRAGKKVMKVDKVVYPLSIIQ